MDLNSLNNILSDYPSFRKKQVYRFIFKNLIDNWDEATSLPADLRMELKKNFSLDIEHKAYFSKHDDAVKALVTFADGAQVETVLMKHSDGRNTVCVSSQVGCALGCDFCATGKLGFKRNLTSSEIIAQVLLFNIILKKSQAKVTNIVFMGMGEPMRNYQAVMESIKFMNDKDIFNLGARRFSVSTVGVVDGIKKLAQEPLEINLAVSIHAPNDILRSKLMPINNKWNLKQLFLAIDNYIHITNRRVMLEYTLMGGVNDSLDQAAQLCQLVTNKLCFVNLITYNKTKFYTPPKPEVIKKFENFLIKNHVACTTRQRFGHDIAAACGQLAARS
jgi:23S rRNA (adenine2503-C2)-methyltransferase